MPEQILTLLKEITLNLDTPNDLVYVAAKQYDALARKVKIRLLHNNAPWVVPSGLSGVIRYLKPDNTRGMYDTDDDGASAIVITAGNNASNPGYITITLARQVLTAKGTVKIEVSLYSAAAEKITTFAFPLVVEEAALSDLPFYESEDYYNFRSDMAEIQRLMQGFDTATQAAVSGVLTIDNTLSIHGAIADAKAAGDMVLVSETEPEEVSNILWIKEAEDEVLVPTMEDIYNIVTPEYDSTNSYDVGDYCIHEGNYYCCNETIASPGEEWTESHWDNITISNEIKNTKKKLEDTLDLNLCLVSFSPELTNGYFSTATGEAIDAVKYARTVYLYNGYGYRAAIRFTNNIYHYRVSLYDESGNIDGTGFLYGTGFIQGIDGIPNYYIIPKNAVKFGLTFHRLDGQTLTDNDYTAILEALKVYSFTDTFLTEPGKPADSQKTGQLKKILMDSLPYRDYYWGRIGTSANPSGWIKGYYDTNGDAVSSPNYMRTVNSKINMEDAICFEIEPPDGYKISILEYDQNDILVSRTTGIDYKILFLANGHKYTFYLGKFNGNAATYAADVEFVSSIKLRIYYANHHKLQRTGNYEWFTVNVERPLSFGGEEVISSTQEIECVLRLPTTYSEYGKPTRLVLACHGAHGYIQSETGTWYNSNWKSFMDSLLTEGYAVFDANVLPTSTGDAQMGFAVGSPLYINVLKRAYDYIVENYNIYPKIFAHGTSMGGVGASAFTHAYPEIVLAESSFAGRDIIQYIYNIWEETSESLDSLAIAYGYSDFSALTLDAFSHVDGLAPSLSLKKLNPDGTITTVPDRETSYSNWKAFWGELFEHGEFDDVGTWIGNRSVPYKSWNSWADYEYATKLSTIVSKAFSLGSACPCYSVTYETGTHTEISYGQINNMIQQLIAWFKRWE